MPTTRLSLTATPGRNYGSFAGKTVFVPVTAEGLEYTLDGKPNHYTVYGQPAHYGYDVSRTHYDAKGEPLHYDHKTNRLHYTIRGQ